MFREQIIIVYKTVKPRFSLIRFWHTANYSHKIPKLFFCLLRWSPFIFRFYHHPWQTITWLLLFYNVVTYEFNFLKFILNTMNILMITCSMAKHILKPNQIKFLFLSKSFLFFFEKTLLNYLQHRFQFHIMKLIEYSGSDAKLSKNNSGALATV